MDKISIVKEQVKLREWADMVRTCRSSGLTVIDWCKDNNLNIKTYYYRLKRVRNFLCDGTSQEIVPVNISSPAVKGVSQIKIRTGKMEIELPSDISLQTLSSMLEVLKC